MDTAGATDYNSGSDYAAPIHFGAITLDDSSITLSNSTFTNNYDWGVYASENPVVPGPTTPSISGTDFTDNGGYAISSYRLHRQNQLHTLLFLRMGIRL